MSGDAVMESRWVCGAAIAEVRPGDLVDVSPPGAEPLWCTVLAVAAGCAEVWANPDAFDGEDRWYCPVDGGCVGVLVFPDGDGPWESALPWWHVGIGDAVYRFRAEGGQGEVAAENEAHGAAALAASLATAAAAEAVG